VDAGVRRAQRVGADALRTPVCALKGDGGESAAARERPVGFDDVDERAARSGERHGLGCGFESFRVNA
jgi:hypothetical protein